MRKSAIILLACMAVLLFAGCSSTETTWENIDETAQALLQSGEFEDELTAAEESVALDYYGIDQSKVENCVFYVGTGATAEEIAIFEATDQEAAKELVELAKKRVEEQTESFRSYNPDELTKLENAVIETRGTKVAVCISGDSDKAKEILDKQAK